MARADNFIGNRVAAQGVLAAAAVVVVARRGLQAIATITGLRVVALIACAVNNAYRRDLSARADKDAK